jgi:inhibitor of cysteine peptidase
MKNFVTALLLTFGMTLQTAVFAQTYVVTEDQGKEVVTMSVGDSLEVILKANPTTGYRWDVTSLSTQWIVLADSNYTPSSTLCGAGGLASYRFVAVSPGTCLLTMAYARPWEKNVPPIQTYALTLIIEPSKA